MNLTFGRFAKAMIGGFLGAAILLTVSYFVPKGSFPDFESVLTLQQMGLIFGGLGGMVASIIALVIKDSYHPETGAAANFSSIHGTGSRFIGKSDFHGDASYLTTEWFCMLWIPLFPVCNYRVILLQERSSRFEKSYTILEKHPVTIADLPKGYFQTVLFLLAIASAVCFLRWIET
jgi:hypothetical protein